MGQQAGRDDRQLVFRLPKDGARALMANALVVAEPGCISGLLPIPMSIPMSIPMPIPMPIPILIP